MRFPWLLKSTREASWRGMRPRPRGTEETTGAGEGTPHLTEPRGLLLVSQAPQTAVAETPCTVPGLQLGMGPEEEAPSPEQEPALSRWPYLVRLQVLPNGLDGVPTLAEHGLEQPLLGLLALCLDRGEGGADSLSEARALSPIAPQ